MIEMQIDEDDAEATTVGIDTAVARSLKTGRILPLVMLRRALGPQAKRFATAPSLCVIVIVKRPDWVPLLSSASRLLGDWNAVIAGVPAQKHIEPTVSDALDRLAVGGRVLCIMPEAAAIPPRLIDAADLQVRVSSIELDDIAKAIRLATGGRPRGLTGTDIEALDLLHAVSAIRCGTSPSSCVRRLRVARASFPVDPRVERAPPLEMLHGYGGAQAWAERLVTDLDRWRAGEIEFSAIQASCILAGPPGVGKSTFVRSLAKSSRLPLFVTSMGELFAKTSGYLDSVVKGIDAVFADARAAGPAAIVFIDELEGIPSRSALQGRDASWWTPVVNHFLTTLDNALAGAASALVVVGATNYPERIDPALARKGRLDRTIWIGPPDEKALQGIYRQHLGAALPGEDLSGIAAMSVGSTGADAVGHIKGAQSRARAAGRPLRLQDIIDEISPPSTLSEDDLWRACLHECGHAVAALEMGGGNLLSVAVGGSTGGGGKVVIERTHDFIMDAERQRAMVVQILAGRAAEHVILGSASGGAGGGGDSDLARASTLVASAHLSFGLRRNLVYLADPDDALAVARRTPGAMALIETELRELHMKACEIVKAHAMPILIMAEHLKRERIIAGARFIELLEGARSAEKEKRLA